MPENTFKRRAFLKLMSTGACAAFCSFSKLAQALSYPSGTSYLDFISQRPTWILHDDGTFDITAGRIRLTNCRPTINGQSIFVRNTFMGDSPKGKRIIYEIDGGFVMLDLRTHSNSISIGAELSGLKNAPALFNPLGEGHLSGATRYFKQGLGTGDQSGISNIVSPQKNDTTDENIAWTNDSFAVTGLIAENGDTLAIGAYEVSDFIQRSSVFNRPRRKGLSSKYTITENIFFESGFVTENIPLKDEFIRLPDLFIFGGTQPFGTLQNLAWNISEYNQARRDSDTNYFWSPYHDFRYSFNYQYLLDQLKTLDQILPPIPLQTVHIGPGYCITGDWLDTVEGWPKTMEDVARQIFQRRYRAGIYVAPFAVHENSKTFKNHPNWILKDLEGNPIVMDEDTEGKLYALDGSHENVIEYIGKVFKSLRKMGFTYYELDYLEWGIKDAADVKRARKGKSSVQVFRAVIEIIREEIGAGSFITANKTVFSPLIGLVDAVRIDIDQSWKWEQKTTARIFQQSYNSQYFNNIFWQNDPDVIFLRNYKNDFTDTEQKTLALWAGFMGGAIGISDNFRIMDSDKLQLWRFIEPPKRPNSATLPYWGQNTVNKVAIKQLKKRNTWALLILNDSEQTITESYSMYELTGLREAWVFYWEPGFSLGLGKSTQISTIMGSHESKLYYISEEKENPSLNLGLSGKQIQDS